MKKFLTLALLAISATASADSVIANGTRFIYPSSDKEITVRLTNKADRPALIQSWLDEGDATVSPDDIKTPFTITPPISRIDGKSGQTLRIRAIDRTGIPTDKESLWYLNILEIPPAPNKEEYANKNVLMMAIRSRFKFIYRPVELGSASGSAKKLSVVAKGKMLNIENPTPFFVSVREVTKSNGKAINVDPETIAPKSTKSVKLNDSVHTGEQVTLVTLNDFGSAEKTVAIVK